MKTMTKQKKLKKKKIDYTVTLNPEQKEAFALMDKFVEKEGNGMFLLKGFAGTGKTFMITKFIEHFMSKRKFTQVSLTAPTNKAVSVLKEAAKGTTRASFDTVHRLLGLKRTITNDGEEIFTDKKKEIPIKGYDLVVVDEVSMLNDDLFKEIKKHAHDTKIIFMGDPAQIPPVKKIDCIPFTEPKKHKIEEFTLTQIMRQADGSDIIGTSFYIRENLSKHIRLLKLSGDKDVKLLNPSISDQKKEAESLFEKLSKNDGFRDCKIIAWRNKTVAHYNKYIRRLIYGDDIDKVMEGERMIFNSPYIEAQMILINNSQDILIKSREIGMVEIEDIDIQFYICEAEWYDVDADKDISMYIRIIHEDSMHAWGRIIFKKKQRAINEQDYNKRGWLWKEYYGEMERFADVDYAYAITAHKSQGSTYEEVVLAMDDIIVNPNVVERNRILYTAITRASKYLTVLNRYIK